MESTLNDSNEGISNKATAFQQTTISCPCMVDWSTHMGESDRVILVEHSLLIMHWKGLQLLSALE